MSSKSVKKKKDTRTALQIFADWISKDNEKNNTIFDIKYSHKVIIIQRLKNL